MAVCSENGDILDESQKQKQTQFYVQRMKIAVAMSVIRSTPLDTTPKKYAEKLCQTFTTDIQNWKEKCKSLEEKIVSLELKLQTMILKENNNIPDEDFNFPDDIANRNTREIQTSFNLITKISNTVDYVRSLIRLGSASNKNLNENGLVDNGYKIGDTVLQNVSLLLNHIRCKDGLMMVSGITKRDIMEVQRLLDSKANFFDQDLMKIIMDFVKKLLTDISQTLDIDMNCNDQKSNAREKMAKQNNNLNQTGGEPQIDDSSTDIEDTDLNLNGRMSAAVNEDIPEGGVPSTLQTASQLIGVESVHGVECDQLDMASGSGEKILPKLPVKTTAARKRRNRRRKLSSSIREANSLKELIQNQNRRLEVIAETAKQQAAVAAKQSLMLGEIIRDVKSLLNE